MALTTIGTILINIKSQNITRNVIRGVIIPVSDVVTVQESEFVSIVAQSVSLEINNIFLIIHWKNPLNRTLISVITEHM